MRIPVPADPAEVANDAAWEELRTVLHDEVNRLPEKYRIPVILSCLEGMPHEEAARLLGCPASTVGRRLARACDLVSVRLMRKGRVLSAASLMAALTHRSVLTEVPPAPLVERTLRGVMRVRRRATPKADAVRSGHQ